MRFLKGCVLFYLGGAGYYCLELLWRGRSHGSMFVLGGVCFQLLGRLGRRLRQAGAVSRAVLGAGMITGLELITGLLVNRDHKIWDYRELPLQYRGQICLMFSCLWMPLALLGMELYRLADRRFHAYFVRSDPK